MLRVRHIVAEALGTAFLLAAIIGSGIMGERLAGGNAAIVLLANSIATGAMLVVLIFTLGPISGAHFNPVVTLMSAFTRRISWQELPGYWAAQIFGAFFGVAVAHLMFGEPLFSASNHIREGGSLAFSECVATFGLVMAIWGCTQNRQAAAPFIIAAYVTSAYWFTSSTSFANPAVTLARSVSDTFAGIRPADVPVFIISQMAGCLIAVPVFRWIASATTSQPKP